MNEAFKFWSSKPWPNDTDPDYLFLGRAVLECGSAKFGTEWTGSEPLAYFSDASLPKPLPAFRNQADHYQTRRAVTLLAIRRTDLGYSVVGNIIDQSSRLNDEHWDIARDLDREDRHKNRDAVIRMTDVLSALVQAFAQGAVGFGLRRKIGGEILAGDPKWWMTEQIKPRFFWCQMNAQEPYSYAVGGQSFDYIYVERASFVAYCRSQRGDKLDGAQPPPVPNTSAETAPEDLFAQMSVTHWYVSVNGERLGKFSSRTGAWISADGLARQAFKKGWNAAIEARRKRLSMSHDGS